MAVDVAQAGEVAVTVAQAGQVTCFKHRHVKWLFLLHMLVVKCRLSQGLVLLLYRLLKLLMLHRLVKASLTLMHGLL